MTVYDDFSIRMKSYEKYYESGIDLTKPVIVRVDGKRFSKYTSKIEKPYSMELWNSMYETMNQVCDKIHADVAYYQSDEVTFIFLPKADTGNVSVVFGGRIQKMASVIASMFTAHFAVNIAKEELNVPVYVCELCGDSDYGDNDEASEILKKCKDKNGDVLDELKGIANGLSN